MDRISNADSFDLFDWEKHFKSYRGTVDAFEKFRFSNAYVVY